MSLVVTTSFGEARADYARRFSSEFSRSGGRPKFVFGCNVYAHDIVKHVSISGFIDEFSDRTAFLDKPIVRLDDVPRDAMVLVASGGRPLSAMARVNESGLDHLDYFAFFRWSGLPLREVVFNEGFADDYRRNAGMYERTFERLKDEASRTIFTALVNFRLTYDVAFLREFTSNESEQYFEDFLSLRPSGETFVDVGCFDGHTSLEFMRRCPGYVSLHAFEPEEQNMRVCRERLCSRRDVYFYPMGLSDRKQSLKFHSQGSNSGVSSEGDLEIAVDRLDEVLRETPTLIKMDIEGGELDAIAGASETIRIAHPKLALSIYHKAGDFWRIPQSVLAIRPDYDLYVRHYTESIYETVMFFVPRR